MCGKALHATLVWSVTRGTVWLHLCTVLFVSLVHFKDIPSSLMFTAMDNSASLLKVGGHRGIRSQSHEIVFHVHRFGKTEASWEAEQSGCKKGDRGM